MTFQKLISWQALIDTTAQMPQSPANNPVHAPKPKAPRESPENLKTEQDYNPAPRLPPN